MQQTGLTIQEKIKYSLLGIIVLSGAVIIGRKLVKKGISNIEERKTYEDGSPSTFAKQVKMAFDNDGWWGTDEEALRVALRRIPTKNDFRQVITSYERLYNSNLLRDMKDELQTSEYNEMLAIIAAKPDNAQSQVNASPSSLQFQSWARRLRAAFNISYGIFPGTDEDAVKAVFTEIPTQSDFQKVENAYRNEFGSDLLKDLKSELELWEYSPMMQIIKSKP